MKSGGYSLGVHRRLDLELPDSEIKPSRPMHAYSEVDEFTADCAQSIRSRERVCYFPKQDAVGKRAN